MTSIPGCRAVSILGGIVVAAMLVPVASGLLLGLLDRDPADAATLGFLGSEVAVVTVAWASAIGVLAVLVGLGPAASLARPGGGRLRALFAAAWLLPLFVSPAVFFDAWWIEVGPDSWIGRRAAEEDVVPTLRRVVLVLGLLGFAVPIATWMLAALRDRGADDRRRLLRLDRPSVVRRIRIAARGVLFPAVVTWLLVSTLVAGLTVPFDLAQVRTWGFELRTLDTRGASPGALFHVGLPGMLASVVAAFVLVRSLPLGTSATTRRRSEEAGGGFRATDLLSTAAWSLLVGIPLVTLSVRALDQDLATAWSLHKVAARGTLVLAIGGGVLGAIVATAFATWVAGRRSGRIPRPVLVLLPPLALVGFMPATLLAVGVDSAWAMVPGIDRVIDGPIPTILAVSSRTIVIAGVLGCLIGASVGHLPRLDAPRSMLDAARALRPQLVAAAVIGLFVGGTLAAGEIPVSARVRPPGFSTLTGALLDAMHYQYADSVLPIVVLLVIAAAVSAAVVVHFAGAGRALRSGIWMLPVALALFGCEDREAGGLPGPVPHDVAFGRPGNIDGRFDYPRALAMDERRQRVYVVDKSARVQRFSLDGTLETWWRMPAYDNGKPTGISLDDEGRVLVADTHEHRIAIFSPDGDLLETHGGLGTAPGQFIYPTDVAQGPDGTWFVSEYGGNDRIQVFDEDWNPIGIIGVFGEAPPDEAPRPVPRLARPQSIDWDDAAGELFIADAVNHRIVVTDREGTTRRVLGGPGLEPGRLGYPYDLAVEPDGTIMVIEFGNNRVQRLDAVTGESLGIWGGTGIEPGRLRYPWGIDAGEQRFVVLDSGNSKVLVGERP